MDPLKQFEQWLAQDGPLQQMLKTQLNLKSAPPLTPEQLAEQDKQATEAQSKMSPTRQALIKGVDAGTQGVLGAVGLGDDSSSANRFGQMASAAIPLIPGGMSKVEFAKFLQAHPEVMERLGKLGKDEIGELVLPVKGKFADLVKKGKSGLEFKADSLKKMEKAIKAGEGLDKAWSPLKDELPAFQGDPEAAKMFARVWGSTSPNTPVGRNNAEALMAWKKVLEGDIPFKGKPTGITMADAKVPNLNRAIAGKPVQGGRGEIGKTENMSQLVFGDPNAIPIDVHALSGVGAEEEHVIQIYGGVRKLLGGKSAKLTYTDIYDAAADAYRHGLEKFGANFPQMWEGVKQLKGQGQSAGMTSWLRKWGLLEPGAMADPKALDYVLQNIDPAEFYGRALKHTTVKDAVPYGDIKSFIEKTPTPTPEEVAKSYAKAKGFPEPGPHAPVKADPAFGKQVAAAYENLKHNPDDPAVKKAYEALASEVSDQFEHITKKGGLKAEAWTQEGQPYKNSKEMIEDVRKNNHLYYFPTDAGYGQGENIADHPLLKKGKSGLPVNDELRVVHDYLAHALGGHQFGPSGEENAFLEHAKMLSPDAIKALATETRGQNSWVNFGPRSNEPVTSRPFAEQKAALLPEKFQSLKPSVEDADLENRIINTPFGEGGIMPAGPGTHPSEPIPERRKAQKKYVGPDKRVPVASEARMKELLQKFGGLNSDQAEEMLQFEHRSKKPGLTEIDPKFFGTGQAGEEKSRMDDPNFIPRLYGNVKGGRVEARFKNDNVYNLEAPSKTIYHMGQDPMGLFKRAQDMAGPDRKAGATLFELLAQQNGFKGYTDGNTVVYFDKLPVVR